MNLTAEHRAHQIAQFASARIKDKGLTINLPRRWWGEERISSGLPVDGGMHLVAVLLGREGIEHHTAVRELEHHILLRRDRCPFHLGDKTKRKSETCTEKNYLSRYKNIHKNILMLIQVLGGLAQTQRVY